MRNDKASIKENPVHILLEAAAEGRNYRIHFSWKEGLEADRLSAKLIERFGKTSRRREQDLFWGCERGPEEGFCVTAGVSATVPGIWAFDEDLKKEGCKACKENVKTAKGIKGGPKV